MRNIIVTACLYILLVAAFSFGGDIDQQERQTNTRFSVPAGQPVPLPTEGTGGEMPLAPQPIATEPQETEATTKTIEELAYEVIRGLWGNGEERKRLLTEAGHDCKAVQQRVNEIMTELKRGRKNAGKNHI